MKFVIYRESEPEGAEVASELIIASTEFTPKERRGILALPIGRGYKCSFGWVWRVA